MTLGQISVGVLCVVIWAVLIFYVARDVIEAIHRRRQLRATVEIRVRIPARPRLGIDTVRHIYLITDDEEEHPK